MPQFRPDRHEVDGQVIETTEVDITADVVRLAMHQVVRAALTTNRAWLNRGGTPTAGQTVTQVDRLTRELNAVFRLLLALDGEADLLADETPDT